MDYLLDIEQFILNFTQEFFEGKHAYKIGHNKYSLKGLNFFDIMLKGLDFSHHEITYENSAFDLDGDGLPDAVDWRAYGYINEIQDQGYFGCCYAFSACTALEAQYCKMTGRLVKLSGNLIAICYLSFA